MFQLNVQSNTLLIRLAIVLTYRRKKCIKTQLLKSIIKLIINQKRIAHYFFIRKFYCELDASFFICNKQDERCSDNILMSVKVGVRVRPFNQRESALNCKLCVDMIGNMTRLFDAQDPDKHPRDYTFDYSFWSHDSFATDQNGYFVAETDRYADQQRVFEAVGLEILSNAWAGYHCCLFAYGQTGSGKSYSMVGYGANKGIVPISCEQIFTRIAKNEDTRKEYEVNVSMMEIYNEKVQDLLIPISKRPKEGHKIREHKTLGIYVEGMSKHFVDTYEAIEKKMQQGGRNRSIAATEMNASSSRAHTIISIEFKQIDVIEGKKKEKLSVIYLVDLAGSQKVGKTGATGDRLKEAAGINKSLSVLGLVISALADKAQGKGKGHVVPYRDSCLTRILQNALGGNSKTLMICAISPATDNYEQTLSTLRYADQAKKIQNKAVVNESETDKLIRTLTEEREELKMKLQKMQEMLSKMSMTPKMLQQQNEAKAQLQFLSQKSEDYSTSRTEKKKQEQEEKDTYVKVDQTLPHLQNLNQDPQLSRKVKYSISRESTKIGKRGTQPPNDIEIGGMAIRKDHAFIIQKDGQFFLQSGGGDSSGCFLNGDQINKEQKIYHMDRLSFGTNNIFLILIPGTVPRQEVDEKSVDWDYAQNELYLKKQSIQRKINEQKDRKLKQETDALLKQKEEQLVEMQRILMESEALRKRMEEEKESEKAELQHRIRQEQAMILEKQKEIESNKKKMKDTETQRKQKSKEKFTFERSLLKTLPKCIELNLIAKQFKKNVSMSVKMMLSNDDDEDDLQMKKRTIQIKVINREVGYSYWWDTETLSNRYYIIKDMSEQYFETGVIPLLQESNDPFWDPQTPTLIGRGFLTTKALAYMFDNPATLPIIGEDEHCGQLMVNLVPTDETGTRNLCNQMDEEEVQFQPEELIEKPLHYLVLIISAKIPSNYRGIYVEYNTKTNEYQHERFKTNTVEERTITPQFNYRHLHKFNKITAGLLHYLTTAKITFKVYGCEIIQDEKKTKFMSKNLESIDPDVEKAKKEDLLKLQKPLTPQPETKITHSNPKPVIIKSPAPETKKVEKVEAAVKKGGNSGPSTSKTAGSAVNNTIGERNQQNSKEKDCQIY